MNTTMAPAPIMVGDVAIWDANGLTETGKEIYTEADCWVLAYYLAQRLAPRIGTGRLVTLGDHTSWWHVAIHLDGDRYLDVLGIHTGEQLATEWSREIVPLVVDENNFVTYRALLGNFSEKRSNHTHAQLVAEQLVATYCPEYA